MFQELKNRKIEKAKNIIYKKNKLINIKAESSEDTI